MLTEFKVIIKFCYKDNWQGHGARQVLIQYGTTQNTLAAERSAKLHLHVEISQI